MNKLDEIIEKTDNGLYTAYSVKNKEGEFVPVISVDAAKKLAIEFTRHILEKAAENVTIEQKGYFEATPEECLSGIGIYDDNGSDRPSFVAFVNKQSITDTLNKYL